MKNTSIECDIKKKIFSNILFEKKIYLVLYVYILIGFMIFVCIQSIVINHQYQESMYPDIEVSGSVDTDGVMRFKMFNSIQNISDILNNNVDKDVTIQGTVIRNLLSIGKAFDTVEYRIWGMNDNDIKTLDANVKKGRLPQKGKKEVLIGSYAAQYFNLEVGDTVQRNLSLDPELESVIEGEYEYVVSGIIDDSLKYFKGSFILSKETWIDNNFNVPDNFIMIYTKSNSSYKKEINLINTINDTNAEVEPFTVHSNYFKKPSNIIYTSDKNMLIMISIIVMILVFGFLLKGIKKKIGLLKALGLPDCFILRLFYERLTRIALLIVGISLAGGELLAILLNRNASKLYGFAVLEYRVSLQTILFVVVLNVLNIVAVCVTVTIICKRISPRDAMLS